MLISSQSLLEPCLANPEQSSWEARGVKIWQLPVSNGSFKSAQESRTTFFKRRQQNFCHQAIHNWQQQWQDSICLNARKATLNVQCQQAESLSLVGWLSWVCHLSLSVSLSLSFLATLNVEWSNARQMRLTAWSVDFFERGSASSRWSDLSPPITCATRATLPAFSF